MTENEHYGKDVQQLPSSKGSSEEQRQKVQEINSHEPQGIDHREQDQEYGLRRFVNGEIYGLE